ncbi:Rossmann-like domain-containing protein [Nocardiopsis xinjiangensis]|uniref:Rossmann-like domain-containing protein n=1 Tax=Nocardiopsis xinjiangensis TaxID=124285 RepID=UPI000349858D|nr:DUF364 domain-containing protein [Nocardiopsis xinjiangensis]
MSDLQTLFDRARTEAGDTVATSVFWLQHGTRLAGGTSTSLTRYVAVRVGTAFGACAFEDGQIDPDVCRSSSGTRVADLLDEGPLPLRVAALDAHLASVAPHDRDPRAEPVELPAGSPEVRAGARDAAVADLLEVDEGETVALIGTVDPLVAAIRERGGFCLPCDHNVTTTRWGDPVADDAAQVLETADTVVATGMTLGNGTFEGIRTRCTERGVPLYVYAQSGAAVARELLGSGVTGLSAEPFPFSQFSAEPTRLFRYRDRVART